MSVGSVVDEYTITKIIMLHPHERGRAGEARQAISEREKKRDQSERVPQCT